MKISREYKIGIFTLISVALLIWGVNFLKGKNVFANTDVYYSVYSNIDGLIESGAVYLRGYKIGTVSGIEFDPNNESKLVVKYSLEYQVKIPKNSVFQIYSSSLVSGIKDVKLLLSNETEYYQSGDTVPGELDRGIAAMIDPVVNQMKTTVNKVDSVISSINQLLNPGTLTGIRSSLNHVENIAASLDKSLSPGGDLNASMKNISSFTQALKSSNENLKNILANFSEVSDSLSQSQLKSAIDNADTTLGNMSEILKRIEKGEGTLGKLTTNDSLYVNLKNVSENLNLLLINLREHPARYVHFSVFGRKEKPADNP